MIHIIKLSVGAESIDDLAERQRRQMARVNKAKERPLPVCGTRSWPKRRAEALAGGSLYWVIKGIACVRQPILAIDEVTDEHGLRCGLYLDPTLIKTAPQPRRAFQGWRYLEPRDAPADLTTMKGGAELPEDLRRRLAELGAW
jgi:hypothetical protein